MFFQVVFDKRVYLKLLENLMKKFFEARTFIERSINIFLFAINEEISFDTMFVNITNWRNLLESYEEKY